MTELDDKYIYEIVESGYSKAYAARLMEVSPRTVGRAIERHKARLEEEKTAPVQEEMDYDFDGAGSDMPDPVYHLNATDSSITIVRVEGSDVEVETVTPADHNFAEVAEIVWSENGTDQFSLNMAYEKMSVRELFRSYSSQGVTVDAEKNRVEVMTDDGPVPMHGVLVDRMVKYLQQDALCALDRMTNFCRKLANNPSGKAVKELYEFLEATDIDISEEGDVICFKKVRADYTDVRTGRFDNSPGATPSEPRNQVDDDSSRTCSRGLHVCSYSYLSHYPGDRVVKVVVDPADVVSIPDDYYGTTDGGQVKAKMRCCRYRVLECIT